MKTQHFSQMACALAFAGLTAFPTGAFADSQRDAALAADRAARRARIEALKEGLKAPAPPIEGVAKANPAETACKLAVHQAALDACKKKGQYNCPYPKGDDLRRCYSKNKTPAPNRNSVPAPKDWVTQPGLLPTTPQPAPTGTGTGPTCTVRFADGTTTVVPTGSLIIPDTQTVYYVGASAPCAVDSFVRLSSRDGLQATVGGGRYKVPAPPSPTPAIAAAANPFTAEAVVTAFTAASGLFASWFAVRAVQKLKTNDGNVIVVTNDAADATPPLLAPPDDPAGSIGDRNTMRPPGNCTPQEHGAMQARVREVCDVARKCNQNTPPDEAANNISKIMLCIVARTRINDRCFMGGNDDHRAQVEREQNALRNCQNRLNR